MKNNIEKIKELRKLTGLSVSECKKALEESNFDLEKAKKKILQRIGELVEKKRERETKEGIIACYVHNNKKIGAMVELLCETDFVSRSYDFQQLAHELCLQIAAMNPEVISLDQLEKKDKIKEKKKELALLEQPWIKNPQKTIKELIEEIIAKTGENITVKRFIRFEV
jgi:elongation factor Ts